MSEVSTNGKEMMAPMELELVETASLAPATTRTGNALTESLCQRSVSMVSHTSDGDNCRLSLGKSVGMQIISCNFELHEMTMGC